MAGGSIGDETSATKDRYVARHLRELFACCLVSVVSAAIGPVAAAWSATGYELAPENPPIVIGNETNNLRIVGSLAVEQATQRFYIGIATLDVTNGKPGEIQQRESNGVTSPSSPFTTGLSNTYFTGVAVNQVTNNLYAAQARVTVPAGTFGEHRMRVYTPAGEQIATFALSNTTSNPPTIATDSTGRVFYPSDGLNTVEIYNSTGALQGTISCTGCPGGAFVSPLSVAIDSGDNAYVVDAGNDRVLKFAPSGGGYVYTSLLQSGHLARSLAVDPSTGDVLVASKDGVYGYHIRAYTSAGVEFDDFAGKSLDPIPPEFAELGNIPLAVNATTHKLYVGDPANFRVLTYRRITSTPPTASPVAASQVGQLTATLNANVSPKGHAILDCEFEYTDDADFQANGFTSADTEPCSAELEGTDTEPIDADLTSLSPNTTYHYRVVAESHAGQATSSTLTFTTLPVVAPTVKTEPATKIVQAGGTLVGTVNPHGGLVSSCRFQYGVSVAYGKEKACGTLPPAATSDVVVQAPVTALTPSTAYHFRFVITTNAGTEVGEDREFTTLPFIPPAVTTSPASAITQSGVTVAGAINPNGAFASCHFEYGTTTGYGSTAPCPIEPGGGTSPVSEELAFTGLAPGTTYHYRLVGSSVAGSANGNDVSFTTQSPPPPVVVAPPPVVQPPPVVPKKLVCKKGFQKKKVRGKLRCVKKKKKRRRRR